MSIRHSQQGYLLITGVLLLAAIAATLAVSLVLLGVTAGDTALSRQQQFQAKALADACMEEALQVIDNQTNFSGTDTLTIGQGSCTYTVTNLGGTNRAIEASGTVDTHIRRVEVDIDKVNPDIDITRWEEVADF